MITWKLLLLVFVVALGIFAVVAAFFAFRSLFKLRSCLRYLEQAKKSLREGRQTESLRLFLKSEKRWELNSYDGGRGSLQKDLQQFLDISGGIFKIVGKNGQQVRSDINGIVSEMKAHLQDRANFGIDGRKMKPESAERWLAMCGRLESLRVELRNCTQPALLRQ